MLRQGAFLEGAEKLKVLVVEDSEADAQLLLRELERDGLQCDGLRVQSEPGLERALQEFGPRIVLSDFAMPGFGGLAALAICRKVNPDLPFIFVSGTIGEHVAVETLKAGAGDYVLKDNLARLAPAVRRELREADARRERRRAQERLAAMARRLATLQEKERSDIARELHDRVGQNLSALAMNLQRLHGEQAGRAAQRAIADCIALVEATGLQVQDVLTELKPPMLAGYGLLDAVRWHSVEFVRRTGIAVEVEGEEPSPRLPPETEMALFRIAQAALNNVAQHAGAQNVRVALERAGHRVRFEIGDDGAGFDPQAALASGRWGFTLMRERAEAIEARLSILSAPGTGARVVLELDSGA